MSASTCIALLRGINVAGRNRVPMAELREMVVELGGTGVRSYIQSGNVVFGGAGQASEVEAELEAAIGRRFDLAVPVIVRPAEEWAAAMAGNPFPAASIDT